jgi:hypothetical protein
MFSKRLSHPSFLSTTTIFGTSFGVSANHQSFVTRLALDFTNHFKLQLLKILQFPFSNIE